jgi:hypothetical protein
MKPDDEVVAALQLENRDLKAELRAERQRAEAERRRADANAEAVHRAWQLAWRTRKTEA